MIKSLFLLHANKETLRANAYLWNRILVKEEMKKIEFIIVKFMNMYFNILFYFNLVSIIFRKYASENICIPKFFNDVQHDFRYLQTENLYKN